jgi:flagellar biosynthetic protein FliR
MVAITLAFPIGAVCLIINIAFGLMNRVAPQINAYFMAMPAQALGGVIISFATLSITIRQFDDYGLKMIQALIEGISLLK